MDIRNKLKNRRKEMGLTMLEVAKKVGVSEATVSRWESGDIANMRRDKIVLLANALQVSPSFIMGWDEEQTPNYDEYIDGCLSSEQTKLLQDFKVLTDKQKQEVIEFIQFKKAQNKQG